MQITIKELAEALNARREEMAFMVHRETGKSVRDALGETDAAASPCAAAPAASKVTNPGVTCWGQR